MDGSTRLKGVDVNKSLTCILCKGYLVDATTIIECLHSFCRTCIVTYLKTSKSCPTCETVVHKTRPHQNIRSDKLLQDLVYKLVPGLYKDEMRRRREFYQAHYEHAPKRPGEERGDEMCDMFIFTPDEQISLAVHLCPHDGEAHASRHKIFKTREEYKSRMEKKTKASIDVRYLQCQAGVTVRLLKKFLRLKYDLPPQYQIDMFSTDDVLYDSLSLADVAYACCWRRKEPLRLSFSIFENSVATIKWGEAIPKLTHSLCLRWRRPVTTTTPTPATTTSPCSILDSVPALVPKLSSSQEVPPVPEAPSAEKAPIKSNKPAASDVKEEPIVKEIKEEVKSPPNEIAPLKSKTHSSSQSKNIENIERKSKPASSRASKKKNLLGKRPATKSPVRIAPAPSKDGPILKMPKMIKLESNNPNILSTTIQQMSCPPSSLTSISSTSAAVPLFPLVSSSLLPAHIRTGQTTSFVKAFPTGYVTFPTVHPPSKPVPNLCNFTPNPGLTSIPANIPRTLTNSSTNISNIGHPSSISKALSSLSLSSPPLPTSTATASPSFSLSLPSSSSLASVKSASASPALTTVVPTTSIASPTPAASASPTPAAVPSQQSQTQNINGHSVTGQHSPFPHTTMSSHNHPGPSALTPSHISSSSSSSVKGYASVNGHTPVSTKHPTTGSSSKSLKPTSKTSVCAPNGYMRAKPYNSTVTSTTTTSVNSTSKTTAPTASKTPSSAASFNLATAPTCNGHDNAQSPPSSGGGGASSQKKMTKPKKIADVANKLHKRVSQTVNSPVTPRRSQSPSVRKQQQLQLQQQQLEFMNLKASSLHESSNPFSINGQNSSLANFGVTMKQIQPLTSSLFDRSKSMHPDLINGRVDDQPLNLVTRDKDFRLSAPKIARTELPPVVK